MNLFAMVPCLGCVHTKAAGGRDVLFEAVNVSETSCTAFVLFNSIMSKIFFHAVNGLHQNDCLHLLRGGE